jgi:hypothetical protein
MVHHQSLLDERASAASAAPRGETPEQLQDRCLRDIRRGVLALAREARQAATSDDEFFVAIEFFMQAGGGMAGVAPRRSQQGELTLPNDTVMVTMGDPERNRENRALMLAFLVNDGVCAELAARPQMNEREFRALSAAINEAIPLRTRGYSFDRRRVPPLVLAAPGLTEPNLTESRASRVCQPNRANLWRAYGAHVVPRGG